MKFTAKSRNREELDHIPVELLPVPNTFLDEFGGTSKFEGRQNSLSFSAGHDLAGRLAQHEHVERSRTVGCSLRLCCRWTFPLGRQPQLRVQSRVVKRYLFKLCAIYLCLSSECFVHRIGHISLSFATIRGTCVPLEAAVAIWRKYMKNIQSNISVLFAVSGMAATCL